MNISERIRILRKEYLHITQEALGEPLGLSRANIANIEAGRIAVTDRVISSICREFSVSEEWLRNGTGEPFIQVAPYEKAYNRFGYIMENSSPSKKAALSVLLELLYSVPDEQWDMIMEQYNEIKKES